MKLFSLFKSKASNSRIDDSKPFSELNIQFDDNHRSNDEDENYEDRQMNKIKKTFFKIEESIRQIALIKFSHLFLLVYENTREFLRNKAMYSEGEDKYLKDLDWVSIVKSIRELKALIRIILNQQQRQILEFERESVLPSNKLLEQQEREFIQNKVPFEYIKYN